MLSLNFISIEMWLKRDEYYVSKSRNWFDLTEHVCFRNFVEELNSLDILKNKDKLYFCTCDDENEKFRLSFRIGDNAVLTAYYPFNLDADPDLNAGPDPRIRLVKKMDPNPGHAHFLKIYWLFRDEKILKNFSLFCLFLLT